MRTNNLLFLSAVVLAIIVVPWFSTSIHGGETINKIRPEITLPAYKSDAARAIEAYERMMNRYMTITERNLAGIDREVRDVAKKLDAVDRKLAELSTKLTRVEKALGIEQPQDHTGKTNDSKEDRRSKKKRRKK